MPDPIRAGAGRVDLRGAASGSHQLPSRQAGRGDALGGSRRRQENLSDLVLPSRRQSSIGVLFLVPTFASFFFSLTRWTLFEATYIGLDNFAQFFREPFLLKG